MREAGLGSRKLQCHCKRGLSWLYGKLIAGMTLQSCKWEVRWALIYPNCPVTGCELRLGKSYNLRQGNSFWLSIPSVEGNSAASTLSSYKNECLSHEKSSERCSRMFTLVTFVQRHQRDESKTWASGERQIWTKGIVHANAGRKTIA